MKCKSGKCKSGKCKSGKRKSRKRKKAANALLNHLKFLFLGFLWRLHAVIEKLSLAWCEMLTLLKNTQSVFNHLCLRINQKTLFGEKNEKELKEKPVKRSGLTP